MPPFPFLFLVDEKIFCCHGGMSPDLKSMEQIRRIMRPTDVPDQGLLCDLLWSDPDKDTNGWGENDRGVSFTFGVEVSYPLNRSNRVIGAVKYDTFSSIVFHRQSEVSFAVTYWCQGLNSTLTIPTKCQDSRTPWEQWVLSFI